MSDQDLETSIRVHQSTKDIINNLAFEISSKSGKRTDAEAVILVLWNAYQAARLHAEAKVKK